MAAITFRPANSWVCACGQWNLKGIPSCRDCGKPRQFPIHQTQKGNEVGR